jgi:hypothetical protein
VPRLYVGGAPKPFTLEAGDRREIRQSAQEASMRRSEGRNISDTVFVTFTLAVLLAFGAALFWGQQF